MKVPTGKYLMRMFASGDRRDHLTQLGQRFAAEGWNTDQVVSYLRRGSDLDMVDQESVLDAYKTQRRRNR